MSKFGSHKETVLLERNALFTLYKNAGQLALNDLLPAAMGLSIRRGVPRGELDSAGFDLRKGGSDEPTMEFPTQTVAASTRIDQFVEGCLGLDGLARRDPAHARGLRIEMWSLFGEYDADHPRARTTCAATRT